LPEPVFDVLAIAAFFDSHKDGGVAAFRAADLVVPKKLS